MKQLFKPESHEKISLLIDKGADIPNPGTIDIGAEVNVDQISGKGVKIYPGCRIYGRKTVISGGCKLGYEGPVTLEDCRLGAGVELKGGFFSQSVFLEKTNMGMGAHVREGCILEEQVSCAHTVGLKHTILFPFVTLGSLINFCDCLMAGGTSRSNHSEVGSSYIHFNFTPDADKTTPSLLGDVPRGVMLNQPPIFLGGQGGIIGPVRLGYGNVVAAGSILRQDYPNDNQLIFSASRSDNVRDFRTNAYPNINRVVENNILYLANLKALEFWYTGVRRPFLEAQEFGSHLYSGAMEQLALAREERFSRLAKMARKSVSAITLEPNPESVRARQEFDGRISDLEGLLGEVLGDDKMRSTQDLFFEAFMKFRENDSLPYIETIQKLPVDVSAKGVQWLAGIVDDFCQRVSKIMPSMNLFRNI